VEAEEHDRWVGRWYSERTPEPFIPLLRKGTALVIDDAPGADVGSIGSNNILGWKTRGCVGVVTGATARDTDEIAAQKVPLSVLRDGSDGDASDQVVKLLNHGVAPASIWDGLRAGAAELVLRQPGIVALHAVTTTNALHYAWCHSREDATRRFVLLQNAAFLPMFREAMRGRGKVADRRIDGLQPRVSPDARPGIEEILAEVSRDRMSAVGKVLAYLDSGGKSDALIDAARRVLLVKGDDAHDYKFSGAVFEEFGTIAPAWRDRFLAVSTLRLHGSQDRDNPLVRRVREAFA